jgi:hypothetical protein
MWRKGGDNTSWWRMEIYKTDIEQSAGSNSNQLSNRHLIVRDNGLNRKMTCTEINYRFIYIITAAALIRIIPQIPSPRSESISPFTSKDDSLRSYTLASSFIKDQAAKIMEPMKLEGKWGNHYEDSFHLGTVEKGRWETRENGDKFIITADNFMDIYVRSCYDDLYRIEVAGCENMWVWSSTSVCFDYQHSWNRQVRIWASVSQVHHATGKTCSHIL